MFYKKMFSLLSNRVFPRELLFEAKYLVWCHKTRKNFKSFKELVVLLRLLLLQNEQKIQPIIYPDLALSRFTHILLQTKLMYYRLAPKNPYTS